MKQERQLVDRILRALPSANPSNRNSWPELRLGPGDDAAVLSPSRKFDWVLSCDAFVEGVHFRTKTHPPDSVGYKSLARATSDLAAMGAAPRYFLLTLALPKSLSAAWLDRFLKGMARASRELRIVIIGGDTTASATISISITVLGRLAPGKAIRRAGARPDDRIYISGKLGRAQLGLDLVLDGQAVNRKFRAEVQPHLYPKIQVRLGAWLAQQRIASAMMDISDGLSTDLARLCAASHVGAKIYSDKIPRVTIPAAVSTKLGSRKLNPLYMALHGGEDYQLLFTVSPSQAKRLRKLPRSARLHAIGETTRDEKVLLIDGKGRATRLKPLGWDPF